MSSFASKGAVAAALVMLAASMAASVTLANEPAAPQPAATSSSRPENPAENALRRSSGTSPIAQRAADRAYCRDLAAKRKLFGLGRHKFLQRCRRARRKAAPTGR